MRIILPLLLAVFAERLCGAPAIGAVSAVPMTAVVGTPTAISVQVSITDPSLIAGGVNLLEVNPDGTTIILGVFHDDGLNGDAFAGDLIFSMLVTLNGPAVGQMQLQVSAAFKGVLQRVKSPAFSIFFQPANAPQQALLSLAQTLASGNRAAALSFINPSTNAANLMNTASQQVLTFLSSSLNAAVLVSSSADSRIFQVPFTSLSGSSVMMEFDMVPGINGQWVINSW